MYVWKLYSNIRNSNVLLYNNNKSREIPWNMISTFAFQFCINFRTFDSLFFFGRLACLKGSKEIKNK